MLLTCDVVGDFEQAQCVWAASHKAPAKSASKTSAAPSPSSGKEILVVASKVKEYIRRTSEMNTSTEVLETLSDHVRYLSDAAVEVAKKDERKTVMGRDFIVRPKPQGAVIRRRASTP